MHLDLVNYRVEWIADLKIFLHEMFLEAVLGIVVLHSLAPLAATC